MGALLSFGRNMEIRMTPVDSMAVLEAYWEDQGHAHAERVSTDPKFAERFFWNDDVMIALVREFKAELAECEPAIRGRLEAALIRGFREKIAIELRSLRA